MNSKLEEVADSILNGENLCTMEEKTSSIFKAIWKLGVWMIAHKTEASTG